jgi:hypothetical protein
VLVLSGSAAVNGRNIHVNDKAKNVWMLAFYEPFGQAQFQNLKQVLAKIRLPWKKLEAPPARDVSQLSRLIKQAQRPGPVPDAVLQQLSASLKRIKVSDVKRRMAAIDETLFLIDTARFLTSRAAGSRRP